MVARFVPAGTGILITFDQGTDEAGAASAQIDCGSVIQVMYSNIGAFEVKLTMAIFQLGISTLGPGSICIWQSSSVLSVSFGIGPTLVPGGMLSLVAGKIRSRTGTSSAASVTPFSVLASLTQSKPSPISLTGPSEIDTCTDFQVSH